MKVGDIFLTSSGWDEFDNIVVRIDDKYVYYVEFRMYNPTIIKQNKNKYSELIEDKKLKIICYNDILKLSNNYNNSAISLAKDIAFTCLRKYKIDEILNRNENN